MAVALAVTVLGVLANCASGSTGTGASGGGSEVASAPATSAPVTPAPATPAPATSGSSVATGSGPSANSGEMTLHGQVEEGVEPGCLILHSGGKTYELMSDNHAVVHAGAQVVVTGHVATGIMSHCMQGQIFQVTSARQG